MFVRLSRSADELRAILPDAMVARPQWVTWRLETRNGKPTKVPYNAHTGALASSTDPNTWSTFGEALAFHERTPTSVGVGFVFASVDPFAGVDLDHCLGDDGRLAAWAAAVLEHLPGAYVERSPSGQGLKLFIRGVWQHTKHRKALPAGNGARIEAYDRGRFFTVTGDVWGGAAPRELPDATEGLAWLASSLFPEPAAKSPEPSTNGSHSVEDDSLLEVANNASNGSQFGRLWRGDWREAYGSQSEADLALCSLLAFYTGPDPGRIDRLFRGSALMRPKWEREDYRSSTIEKALAGRTEFYSSRSRGAPAPTPRAVRPRIMVRGALAPVADEAQAALLGNPRAGLYTRGRMLVHVVRDSGKARSGLVRAPGTPVIVAVAAEHLREQLDRSAEWVTWDSKKKAERPALPPGWVAPTLLSRGEWPFPHLEGVLEAPTMLPDGRVLEAEGYDADSGFLLRPSGAFPRVPSRPTRTEAIHAAARLLEPLADFPFVVPSDRATAVAAILSLVGRPAIPGCVPLYAIRATAPGTGKGLLADVIITIGTGRVASRMTLPRSDSEMRKVILTVAIEGAISVLLDNLVGALGSSTLSAAMTAEWWEDRILGESVRVRAPLRAVWLATGNGLVFKGDLGRRALPVDLDARTEHPEDRTGWTHDDLLGWVRDHRLELVAAALTLLRGYHVAGRPAHGSPPKGSFEGWDALVRGACVWAQLGDPCGGTARIRSEDDTDVSALAGALAAWLQTFGDVPKTAAEVVSATLTHPTLRDALLAMTERDQLDARSLGYSLRRVRGRIVDGLRFAPAGTEHRTVRWLVVADRGQGVMG